MDAIENLAVRSATRGAGASDRSSLDWDLYRYFLAVAQTKSFSGAALKLKVSAQTVSRKIAQLEHDTGSKLFVKTQDRYLLSPTGETLVKEAEAIDAVELRLLAKLAAAKTSISGTVKMSVSDVLSGHWLIPNMASLTARHPELHVDVLVDGWPVSIRRREADILLRLFGPGEENLVGRKIGLIRAGFYASRAYADQCGLPQDRSEWRSHSVVGIASMSTLAHWSDHVTKGAKVSLRCSSHNDVLRAIKAGLGIGLLVCLWGDAEPDLVRIAPSKLNRAADIWLLAHPDLNETPAVRTLLDYVTNLAARDTARLAGETLS
jgi:DNA-binding transcriptional LysR family regulator